MQIFSCPFCGPRDETEFRFVGAAGNTRPAGSVSAADWSRYLYAERAVRGRVAEIWAHVPCSELFRMDRDNVTHVVHESLALRAEGQR